MEKMESEKQDLEARSHIISIKILRRSKAGKGARS
jgi:hypothetical protein